MASAGEADARASWRGEGGWGGRLSVAITEPVTAGSYATASDTLALAGVASDFRAITRVTWESDRGGGGEAIGTDEWSVPGIPLQPGVNWILVTAYNEWGSWRQDKLAVTYTPPAAPADTSGTITPTPDTAAPTAPSGLSAAASSSSQINLSWSAASDDVGVVNYRVVRCQGAGCASFTEIATVGGTSYSNTGLAGSTSYSYLVRAADAAGNLSDYSAVTTAVTMPDPDTTAPTAPSGLSAAASSSSQINLSWNAASDSVGVTGYRVERCQGAGCSNFAQVATVSGTGYTNTGLSGSTSYTYRVRAGDAAGNLSGYSASATAVTLTAPDTTAPTAPSGLSAAASSSSQINLSWNAASDSVGVTGYRVERCQGAGCGNFAQIATVSGTSYSNTGLSGSTSYSYRVRAGDAAGNLSSYSAKATAVTATDNRAPVISGSPATTVTVGSAYTFAPTASDPDGQALTFSVMGEPGWASIDPVTGVLSGTPGAGDVGLSEGIVITVSDGTTYASLPAFSLEVVQAATGSATVSWLPPTQRTDGSALTNLGGYHIRYGTSPTALTETITLNGTGLTSYTVEGLTPGNWYFGVSAFDTADMESALSNIGSKSIL
jgi:chitodextrinase